jgi:cellulose synthase operon protein C
VRRSAGLPLRGLPRTTSRRALGFCAELRCTRVLGVMVFAAATFILSPLSAQTQPNSASARITAAERAFLAGERDTPRRTALAIIASYERGASDWPADELIAAGRAYLLVARQEPVRGEGAPPTASAVRAALRAFDAATARDPSSPEGTLRAADLFLERYNAPDARAGYEEVLAKHPNHPRALLGLARVMEFEGNGEALAMARRASAQDPRLAEAHLAIARMMLDAESMDSARAAARRSVAADPMLLEGWGVLGAVAWLRGDSANFRGAKASAEQVSRRPAAFYVALSEAATRHRRYADAERFAAEAVAVDSVHVAALGALGTNRLRRGDLAGGRRVIERAFAIDPFHLWHKNTLDLLDVMDGFARVETGRFEYVGPRKELDVLLPYLAPLLEEAYDSLAARFNYRPPTPVRFEFFDRHADFSVRTVGLTGLGALGVSFGTTLAMDAPSARERGAFNWGSTAWHELAHTFALGLSDHRVPRWFTEGLSVLEERRARPGWGAQGDGNFLGALRADALRKVSELNDGFVRPRDPGEIGRSYFQASLVCEMLAESFGPQVFSRMLQAWGEGLETPAVLQRVLNVTEAQLDAQFTGWLAERYKGVTVAQLPPSDSDLEPLLAAVTAARARGDDAALLAALERVQWIWPYELELHAAMADAAARLGRHDVAVRERRVILALGPADQLDARYRLAVALRDAGDVAGARREVLRVLEQAPTFERAQRLLLELRGAVPPERR